MIFMSLDTARDVLTSYLRARAAIPAGNVIETQLSAALLSDPAVLAVTVVAGAVDDTAETVTRAVDSVAVVNNLTVVAAQAVGAVT